MPDTVEETPPAGDRTNFRLAALGAVLVVVLFTAYGIGRLSEGGTGNAAPEASATAGEPARDGAGAAVPDDTGTAPHEHGGDGTVPHEHGGAGPVTPVGGAQTAGAEGVGGLAVTAAGLTITPRGTTFPAGRAQPLRFAIAGPGGAPITTYAIVHDKPLHLIVIRRDLTGFQHLHPTMAPDGTWSVDLTLAAPGSYRAVADFTAIVGGRPIATTLGVDLTVAGNYAPVPLPAPVRQAAVDGFTVGYEGTPSTGSTQPLLMTVATADGRPAAVEPYLGAFGHLVVLREGDLGYVHVHPEAQPVDGKLKFWLAAPGPGRYRMFFDFKVAGRVHTAAWTAVVG
ncbi:hypothetical protein [Jidongwangia harbinensis]|uniref:hypothetical protein n=1 Tax=Jidongwangia harbinensis TaxID=2878561 RepID=UPI001CD9FD31|nr:hypothetical protein [Jidongwangia harbinensis]MCA2213055.1 hypothetical protein [Jidongwangia harbinensis]